MKKNNPILNVALALSLSTALGLSCAQAGEGGGDKGNGGSTVNKQLLDLITNARCDRWVSGSDLMKENRHIEITFSALSKTHWPLATLLRSRIELLDFCMTGPLRLVGLEKKCEGRAPVTMYVKNREQVAVRFESDVYVDQGIFKAMPSEKERAYLMIHEAAHDFFPQCSDMRTFRLHTFVKNIEKLESGVIKTREDFIFQMEKNGIEMNFSSDGLDSLRTAIEFMRLDYSAQRKMILAGQKDLFLNSSQSVEYLKTQYCTQSGYNNICSYTIERLVKEPSKVLNLAFQGSDNSVIKSLLNVQLVDGELGARALSNALDAKTSANEQSLQFVIQSKVMSDVLSSLSQMSDKDAVVKNSRLYFSSEMNSLFNGLSDQPIYRASRTAESQSLAAKAQALVAVWGAYLKISPNSLALKSISSGNVALIQGLSLVGFNVKLKAKAVLDDDYTLSSSASVRTLQTFFAKAKGTMIQSGVSTDNINQFFNQFSESDLGYKIQE
jgi:hypothetical protein